MVVRLSSTHPGTRRSSGTGTPAGRRPMPRHAPWGSAASARPARHRAPSRSFGTTLPRGPASVNRSAG